MAKKEGRKAKVPSRALATGRLNPGLPPALGGADSISWHQQHRPLLLSMAKETQPQAATLP